mmetsp:Transcript_23955/g.74546  ORF Transcript_23955/g.74546 Transcript_23955/m.74546 type:complete len:270 (+) Transcript_23955:1227-2036(+)
MKGMLCNAVPGKSHMKRFACKVRAAFFFTASTSMLIIAAALRAKISVRWIASLTLWHVRVSWPKRLTTSSAPASKRAFHTLWMSSRAPSQGSPRGMISVTRMGGTLGILSRALQHSSATWQSLPLLITRMPLVQGGQSEVRVMDFMIFSADLTAPKPKRHSSGQSNSGCATMAMSSCAMGARPSRRSLTGCSCWLGASSPGQGRWASSLGWSGAGPRLASSPESMTERLRRVEYRFIFRGSAGCSGTCIRIPEAPAPQRAGLQGKGTGP